MQFRLVKQWRKAGTGGASAALQRITSTNTHTALPPPPARASLQLTGATETRTGSGGLRRGEDKAGTVKQRKSWSGAGISPESLTRIPRLKPPTAAPLSPAGRARRQGTLESRSQVVLCPARQDPSGGGQRGVLRKVRSLGDRRWRPSWCPRKSRGEENRLQGRVRGQAAAAAGRAASCALALGECSALAHRRVSAALGGGLRAPVAPAETQRPADGRRTRLRSPERGL